MKATIQYLIIFCFSSLLAMTAIAADLPGSKDHPMISRYEGAEIIKYDHRAFDSINLITAPIPNAGGKDKNPDALLKREGKLTRITYKIPAGRSTLEVLRNYEQALTGAGFEALFSCENQACSGASGNGRTFNQAATPNDMMVLMGYTEKDQRYLFAKLARPEGEVYAAIYLVRAYGVGGPNKDSIFVNLDILESALMQTDMVKVDAEAMRKGLDAEGHIALYELYFDTNQAELKPESRYALGEIATLLKGQPNLNVLIVGHTDNVGALDYNRDLAERRAKSVVIALISQHGLAANRLTAVGVGMAAPVASNDGEVGRAKNRRVELVKR